MSQTHAPAGPPQMPEGYTPQQPAPAKKPFYKKAWFLILAVIVVIVIATQSGGGDSSTDSSSSTDGAAGAGAAADAPAEASADAPAEAPANVPGIGQPAADGDFNFVVNGVDCSTTQIGNEFLNTKAQGQFCVVDLTISNIGDEAQSFFGDNAKLFNAQGQEFSADTEAAIYLEESSSLYEEINPGNTLNSKVVFDVPAGTTPASIELHDSMFSGGVTVNLQ
ncbi:DUF4352 domain-containing protein [Geodermatophilus sabuli]|uniref:DUF4352 domain-containing protein n=1 Tax=Geodermatophilus sabuli TaxID=1564158 RepID=A0A285EI48_9ACTN|nr:DUF4352 domain-containing protein [Geodermatophilus sabuli]MBB3086667.1 hypothetical protein [Geodermatophilus sabuli]SNX97681.1 protein of unknown function [Geodermatophilus sabuli]